MDKNILDKYIGKTITNAEIDDYKFVLLFSDDSKLVVKDTAQWCCEQRYMRTDDNPKDLIGHVFCGVETKDTTFTDEGDYSHEICFVEIQVDDQVLTLQNHNEHNGYYGGFDIMLGEG